MGKVKQLKEKKFNRNVEISAPILDPEIIKAIHSPPKGQRLDLKHGGFRALLSDLNSQDSTDEMTVTSENHLPSYIGISCAVSGYSNYTSYTNRPNRNGSTENTEPKTARITSSLSANTPNRSRATSPMARFEQHINHIKIDKSNIHSADEERRELTEKLTASAHDRRRSPSPCIPPTEDDRHHGAYVGARYCPLPEPSKLVNKHIPLLGIDDDQDPEQVAAAASKEKKVEKKIASLYGDKVVEDWRESMTHKSKKELEDEKENQEALKSPKDLVTLKPTPQQEKVVGEEPVVDVPVPNAKVLAGVEKQFLNKLLTDENPPVPSPQLQNSSGSRASTPRSPMSPTKRDLESPTNSVQTPVKVRSPSPIESKPEPESVQEPEIGQEPIPVAASPPPSSPIQSQSPIVSPSPNASMAVESPVRDLDQPESLMNLEIQAEHMSPVHHQEQTLVSLDSGKSDSPVGELDLSSVKQAEQTPASEGHIEYEIRAQSPVDNQESPLRVKHAETAEEQQLLSLEDPTQVKPVDDLVCLSADTPQDSLVESEIMKPTTLIDFDPPTADESSVVEAVSESTDKQKEQQEERAQDPASDTTASGQVHDGRYYLDLLQQEISFISEQVTRAEFLLESAEGADLDEDTQGIIHSAVGKANLLINKKCKQFRELCESNINQDLYKQQFATLNDDLAGFWDMMSIQIEEVRKMFASIWRAESNNWKFEEKSTNLME